MAKKQAPKRLADMGKQDRDVVTDKIKDWLDHELTITSAKFKVGEHGTFAVFEATDGHGHEHVFTSGAMFVLDALQDAVEQDCFPLGVKFYMKGNTVFFT